MAQIHYEGEQPLSIEDVEFRRSTLARIGLGAGVAVGTAFFTLVALPDSRMDIFGDGETRRDTTELDAMARNQTKELASDLPDERLYALMYMDPETIRIGRGEGGNGLVGKLHNLGVQRYEVGQDCLDEPGAAGYNTRQQEQPKTFFDSNTEPIAIVDYDEAGNMLIVPGNPLQKVWRFAVTEEGLVPDEETAKSLGAYCQVSPTPVIYRYDTSTNQNVPIDPQG